MISRLGLQDSTLKTLVFMIIGLTSENDFSATCRTIIKAQCLQYHSSVLAGSTLSSANYPHALWSLSAWIKFTFIMLYFYLQTPESLHLFVKLTPNPSGEFGGPPYLTFLFSHSWRATMTLKRVRGTHFKTQNTEHTQGELAMSKPLAVPKLEIKNHLTLHMLQ